MAPSSIPPAGIMHRAAAKTFLNETQKIPQVPDTFPPIPPVGTAFLDPPPRGKVPLQWAKGEQSALCKKCLHLHMTWWDQLQRTAACWGHTQPSQMWGTKSHSKPRQTGAWGELQYSYRPQVFTKQLLGRDASEPAPLPEAREWLQHATFSQAPQQILVMHLSFHLPHHTQQCEHCLHPHHTTCTAANISS